MIKGDSRMSNPESGQRIEPQEQEHPVSRRSYVKPAFSCERVFETMALGCTVALKGGACPNNS